MLLEAMMTIMAVLFSGHLGKNELAAASLANSVSISSCRKGSKSFCDGFNPQSGCLISVCSLSKCLLAMSLNINRAIQSIEIKLPFLFHYEIHS